VYRFLTSAWLRDLSLEGFPEHFPNRTQTWLFSLEVKNCTSNWHKWSQIDQCIYKDCFSHQQTETPSESEGQSLFHQLSGCATSLISIAQSWHGKRSGESGSRHGGCTVSSVLCFRARSVKGTVCSPHKHLCKLGTVTTGWICSPSCTPHTGIWYSLRKGYSAGENWAPRMQRQPKRVREVDLDSSM